MNNQLTFKNPNFGEIRVAGTSEEPLFCLADVCKALDLRQGDVRQRLTDGVVSTQPITDSLGREQQANFVNEDGLYDVILDSRKLEAKQFRKWLTSEVLPSIRKTGGFVSDTSKFVDSYFGNLDEAARTFLTQSLENNKRLLDENKKQKQLIEQQAPKVEFFDAVADSKTAVPMNDVAKVLSIKGYGRNNLFEFLRNEKILMQDNRPYQTFIDRGYFRVIEQHYQVNGESHISFKTLVYQKGVDFIRRTICDNKSK